MRRRTRIPAAVFAIVAGAAAAVLAVATTAGSAPTVTETHAYTFSGSQETFTVPAGVTSVNVVAVGGKGGNAAFGTQAPGFGGRVSADLPVTPGSTLYVTVGGNGGSGSGASGGAGGFNGGAIGGNGSGANSNLGGGGGAGGASDIRTSPSDLTSRVVVAAGGGGPGAQGNIVNNGGVGGNAETIGGTGGGTGPGGGGGAGTDTAGGAGGASGGGCGNPGTTGTFGEGGAGAHAGSSNGGGGGGAGYYGGGGGGSATCGAGSGGGGGGSNFAAAGATSITEAVDASGTPSVTIRFTPQPQPAQTTTVTDTASTTSTSTSTATTTTPAPPPDTTAPDITLSGVPKRVAFNTLVKKGIRVRVTPDETAKLEADLRATSRGARIARYELVIATGGHVFDAAPQTIALKPRRSLVGRPRKAARLRVTVRAFDAAGNVSTKFAHVTVTPPRR